MTIYFPDESSFQAGVSNHGALAVVVKATEGTSYVNPALGAQVASARAAGSVIAYYHFLYSSKVASISAQAAHAFNVVGTRPLALDVEEETQVGSTPTIADVENFIDDYRALGGVIYVVYLPRWYWQQIGSPSLAGLASRHCVLWSSDYAGYTDSDSGAGWQPYGGMTPAIWQYTDALSFGGVTCDFSAFRGSYAGKQDPASVAATVAEFKLLVETGSITPPSPGPHAHHTDGRQTIGDYAHAVGMRSLGFTAYQGTVDEGAAQDFLRDCVPPAGREYFTP